MKNRHAILASALSVALTIPALGQGTFQNLDFEGAFTPLVPDGNGFVSSTQALPGWTIYLGSEVQPLVLYDKQFLGTAAVGLLGPAYPIGKLEGSYSLSLQPGLDPQGHGRVAVGIAQSGQVPSWAKSLRFAAWLYPGSGEMTVSFAGQIMPVFAIGPGTYGVDINLVAGMAGELRFTAADKAPFVNDIFLDAISFSAMPASEPGLFTLFALGALALAWRARRRNA